MSAKKQKLHFLLMLFMLVSGLVLLASCRPDLAKINNIFIQKNGLTVESSLELDLYVASEHTFTVLIDKEGDISEAVIFASSNAAVATITPQGVLTLLSKGVTTISATSVADNSVSASFVLTVVDSSPEPSITSVIIDSKGEENKIQLPLSNDEVTFTATVVVVGGASENVIWESSNTQVAIIDSETGVLTFIGVGVTNITATSVFDDTKFDIVEVTVLPQDLSKPDTVPFGWKELQLVWTADGSYGMYSGPEIDGKMPYFERVSNNYFKSMNINPGGNTFNRGDFLRFGVWAYSNKEQIVTINIPYGYNPQNAPKTYTLEANTWTWIQTDKYPASDRINGYIQANSADTLYLTGMQIIKEINPGPASIVSVKIIQGAVPSDTPLNPNSTYGGASGIQVETLTIEKTMGIPDFYIVPLVAAAAGASQSVTWESSDPNVATVTKVASTATNTYGFNSELGLVHLVGGGQTTLTVRAVDDPTKFATVILNVDAPLPSVLSVFINGKNQEGKIERDIADGNFTLTSLVSVVGGASQEVVWTSSDTDVATIDPNTGLVTVIAQGTTTITATSVLDDTKLDTVDLIIGTETVPLPDDIPEGWEEIELNWTADATYVRYEGGAIDGRMPYFVRTSNNYIKMLNVNPGASTFTKGDYLRFGAWVYSNKEQVVTINIPYGYNSQNVPKTYTLEANTWTWIQTDKYPASDRINPYIQANGADVLYVSGMQLIKESVVGDPEIHSVKIITNANPTAGTLASNGTYSGAQVSNIEINKQITDDDFYIVPLVAAAYGASQSVIWESSDPNVATVTGKNPPASNYGYNSEIGLVHIVGAGTVTLTVKSVDDPTKFATVTLTVPDSAPSVLSVLINGKSQEGKIKRDIADGNFTLTSTVIVVGGASKEVVWTSSDTDVATIDPNTGLVTVIAKGTTTITATSVFDDTKLDVADLVISDETVPAPDAIADGWEEIELNWTADATYIRYEGDPVDGRMPYFVRASNNYIKMLNVNPGASTFTKGDYLRFGAWVYSNKEQVVTINIPYGYNSQHAPKTYTLEANTWTWIQTDKYPASDRINPYIQANSADVLYVSGMQLIKESVAGDPEIHSIRIITNANPTAGTLGSNGTYSGAQVSNIEINKQITDDAFYIVPLVAAAFGASQSVIWESSDPNVATVTGKNPPASNYGYNSEIGLVHIVGAGTVTLTVKSVDDPTKFATVTLTVPDSAPSVLSVLINGKSQEGEIKRDIAEGNFTLTSTVIVVGGASKEVIWESSDTDIATIDSNTGLVTVIAKGTTTITATSVFDDTKLDVADLVISDETVPAPDAIADGWEEIELNWTADPTYIRYDGDPVDGRMPYFVRASNNYIKMMNVNPGANTFTKGDYLRFGAWVYSNKVQVVSINLPYGYNPQNAPKSYTLEANTWTWIQTDKYPASDRINPYIQANSADVLYVSGMQLIKESVAGDPEIHSIIIISNAVPSGAALSPNNSYGGTAGVQVSNIEISKQITDDDFYVVPLVAAAYGASQSVTWESSDTDVATVTAVASTASNTYGFNSELGLVHLVGGGTVTLTVKSLDDPTKVATVTLTVIDTAPSVTSVLIDGKDQEGEIKRDIADGNFSLTATVIVKNGASQEVIWESSNTDIATIDPNTGLVTVIAKGMTSITATSVFDDTKLDVADLVISDETVPAPDAIADGWEEIELNWTADPTYIRYEGAPVDGRMPYFVRASNNYIKMLNVNPGANTFTKGDYLRFGAWVYSNKVQVVIINIPYGYNSQHAPKTYTLEANTWTWIQTDKYPASDRINPYIQANSADVLYVSGMQLIKESVAGDPEIHSIRIITNANPTAGTLGSNGTYSGAQVSNIEISKQATDGDFYIVPLVAAAYGASQSVIWESSDPNVATVTSKNPPASNFGYNSEIGLVHIVGGGTVTLTVKSVDDPTKVATVTLTVIDTTPSVTSVLIDGKDQEGEIKRDTAEGNFSLTATVIVKNGASQEVIWESSDTDIATIDPNTGLVTVIAKGTTTITATSVFDDTKLDVADLVISDETVPAPDAIADGWEEIELNWTADPTYIRYNGDPVDGRMPYFVRASNNYIKMLNVNPGANTFTKGDYLRFGAWVYSNKEQVVTINIPYGYNPQNAPKTYTLEANTWTWIQTDKYPASDRINPYIQANNADVLYVSGMQLIKESVAGDPEIHSIIIISNAVPTGEALSPNNSYGGTAGVQVSNIEINKQATDGDFYIVPLVAAAFGASQSVTWESSDTDVATVTAVASTASNTYGFNSELGLVHIVGAGTVTLIVKSVDDPTKVATVTLIIS